MSTVRDMVLHEGNVMVDWIVGAHLAEPYCRDILPIDMVWCVTQSGQKAILVAWFWLEISHNRLLSEGYPIASIDVCLDLVD